MIGRTSNSQTLEVTVSATSSSKVTGGATTEIIIARRSSGGSGGSGGGGGDGGVVNTAPTTPIISKSPPGNVSPTDNVTITANSTDAENDAITYVWTGRIDETSVYPIGKHIITVKAVDEHGAESPPSAIVFFVTSGGTGGMMLTDPESRIYENGIPGASIVGYTFNVPSVSGHYGDDYSWVKGLNINTGQWDQLDFEYTANGITLENTMSPGQYNRLEFFYYASHCMYNQSNITYTVEFAFDADLPGEAEPVADNVEISGTPAVNQTLEGMYDYSDGNGDLEGASLYQWYLADDADGTNMTPTGIIGKTYVLQAGDLGKYLFFEVTPISITGFEGTTEGDAVMSSPFAFVEEAPVAENVYIDGIGSVGLTLDGVYTYSDVNGDPEGLTTFQWYRDDVPISGATNTSYTLTDDDLGTIISFEVTPIALTGNLTGESVISEGVGPINSDSGLDFLTTSAPEEPPTSNQGDTIWEAIEVDDKLNSSMEE